MRAFSTVGAAVVLALLAFAPSALADPPTSGGLAPPAPPNPAPSISGTALDGETLTGSNGGWGAGISFSYEWFRCDDAAGTVCDDNPVAGRTAITYLLGPSDVGRRLKLRVRGTGLLGFREADSQPTGVIQAIPPSNTALPVISGTARAGQMLSTTDGAWTGTPTLSFTRQWQRCDSAGANCTDISGATGSSYTATRTDMGSTLRARVTADNSAPGTVSAVSAATAQVDGIPLNTGAPVVSGSATTGQTLTSTNGTWTGFPTPSFSRQWVRCDSAGANCADVGGETNSTYTLGDDDIDKTLKLRVTATNTVGSAAPEESALTAAVVDPPANTGLPVVSGTEEVGQTLNATNGTWTGTPTPTFARQWFRCNSAGSSCAAIAGATSLDYTLGSADAGRRLKLRVTADNPAPGTVVATSALTGVIEGPPTVSFGFSPSSPETGQRVFFTATAADPDGGTLALDWDLDNDGAFDDATGASASRIFTSSGTRTVRLRATDDEAHSVVASRSVRVVEPPAPVQPPSFDIPGPTTPTPEEPVQAAFIRPFPVVRIAGRATRRGARITLLAVRAPRGSLVRVRCKGGKRRGCKYKRARKIVGSSGRVRIKGLQRRLRAGAVIAVLVTRPGEIGKFTRFRIRRRKAPTRRDYCLAPGSSKPTSCEAL